MYNIEELKDKLLSELKEIAEELGVTNFKKLSKQDLIYKILDQQAYSSNEKLPKKPAKVALLPQQSPARPQPQLLHPKKDRNRKCAATPIPAILTKQKPAKLRKPPKQPSAQLRKIFL